MIAEIHHAARRPPIFEPSTGPFWDDPYIASRLLEAHLDSGIEAASRPGAVIEATITRLVQRGLAGPGRRVLDLGCGPGLYAHRLAAAGCVVTGLDLSAGSIAYARRRAAEEGLTIDYRVQDFCGPLSWAPGGQAPGGQRGFDLVLQSYGEMATFPDHVRDGLLGRIRDALAPGGVFLFDVTTPVAHRGNGATRQVDLAQGGLWRPGPHVVVTDRYEYPDDVTCHQYVVADDEHGVHVYRMWFHDYTPATLTPVLAAAGLEVQEIWGSLDGAPYNPAAEWFAVVACRASRAASVGDGP